MIRINLALSIGVNLIGILFLPKSIIICPKNKNVVY